VAHCLTVCFRMAGLKLPVSCCCNSSVHCSTGPQQNVDDDYCVSCVSGKGSRRGVTGYSYIRGSHFFLNKGPAWSKFGPGCYYTHNYLIALCPGGLVPEETFTHSHSSWSSDMLYQLPPSTATHSILLVKFTCLTVLFHNLCPGPAAATTIAEILI